MTRKSMYQWHRGFIAERPLEKEDWEGTEYIPQECTKKFCKEDAAHLVLKTFHACNPPGILYLVECSRCTISGLPSVWYPGWSESNAILGAIVGWNDGVERWRAPKWEYRVPL